MNIPAPECTNLVMLPLKFKKRWHFNCSCLEFYPLKMAFQTSPSLLLADPQLRHILAFLRSSIMDSMSKRKNESIKGEWSHLTMWWLCFEHLSVNEVGVTLNSVANLWTMSLYFDCARYCKPCQRSLNRNKHMIIKIISLSLHMRNEATLRHSTENKASN